VTLWWIGNGVLLIVVVPALIFVLNRVVGPALEIAGYADDLAEHGTQAATRLEALEDIKRTAELSREAGISVERYAAALDDLLREERR
jgi:hypothetical protein